MTYVLTPPQPAATLEAIRDGRPAWLVLEPTTVEECRHGGAVNAGVVWRSWCGLDWEGCERRTRTVSGPALPRVRREWSGRVPSPLLIQGEQHQCPIIGCWSHKSTCNCADKPRRSAGLAVLDRPDWLPVVQPPTMPPSPDDDPEPHVLVRGDRTWLWAHACSYFYIDVTDQFPEPPPVGSLVTDLSSARWLDDPITAPYTEREKA